MERLGFAHARKTASEGMEKPPRICYLASFNVSATSHTLLTGRAVIGLPRGRNLRAIASNFKARRCSAEKLHQDSASASAGSAFRDRDDDAVAPSDLTPRTAVAGDDADLQFELLADPGRWAIPRSALARRKAEAC